MNWMEGLQAALDYIEAHLTEEIRTEDVAAQAYVSGFHFQRIFSALCGVTLGEYIRYRRLTLAAEELSGGDVKVIDAALKYGYDSPDSFARAFARFHGISPSAAREKGARLNAFAPLRMKIVLEGGGMMEYRIVEKAAFTVMGVSRRFRSETAHQDIPVFWDAHMEGPMAETVRGMFGLCLDSAQDSFDYMIADSYAPWLEVPEGCTTHTVPAGTWAVFTCRGAHPEALQRVDARIWKEWLPGCREYRPGGNYSVEFYIAPDHSEIWVPVVKA
ncbi:MAG: AraC family transcriptional regulator [Clostridia bacterium]|nr:AraC family transcriptional regulator [Clostridia bacterium]